MHPERRQAYEREMQAAVEHYSGNNLDKAFYYLERAHILANRSHSFTREPTGGCSRLAAGDEIQERYGAKLPGLLGR
jgi:hypothetical protein